MLTEAVSCVLCAITGERVRASAIVHDITADRFGCRRFILWISPVAVAKFPDAAYASGVPFQKRQVGGYFRGRGRLVLFDRFCHASVIAFPTVSSSASSR